MFISMLRGGLGNQAFQYIFARYLEESADTRVYIDDSYFSLTEAEAERNRSGQVSPFDKLTHNGYELEYVFPNLRKPLFLSEYFEPDVWRAMVERKRTGAEGLVQRQLLENGMDLTLFFEGVEEEVMAFPGKNLGLGASGSFDPCVAKLTGNVYFYGNWICRGWFEAYKDIFSKEFSFRPIEDAVNRQYKDEIEWRKANARELGLDRGRVTFVEGNYDFKNNYIDIQLMSMCDLLVMSPRSSFGFLADILSPKPWFRAIQFQH